MTIIWVSLYRRTAARSHRGAAAGWIDVREAAMDRYNAELQNDLAAIKVWNSGVDYYYFSSTGLNVTQWPHGMERMAAQLAYPEYEDYEAAMREDTGLADARRSAVDT